MRKDPTEFRKRFAAWKNGKLPYEAGLPKYADGKGETVTDYPIPFIKDKVVKLTDAGLATGAVFSTNLLDSIADNADRAGLDLLTALGLATKESTLGNPTDDRSMRTLLSALRQKELTDHLLEVYGLSYDLLFGLHINRGDIVRGQELINWYNDKNNIEHKPSPPLSTTHPDRKSVIQKAFEFYKQHPDKYNPGQKNYQRLVDKRGAEVMLSPEVLKWLKERNIKKATGRFNRLNPLLNESKFNLPKYKDGKLPKYGDGTKDTPNYSDVVYKNMYWQGNDVSPEYQYYVRGGAPEDVSLSYVKEQVNRYPDLYYIKGPTLPEVVVKPDPNSISTALLTTYYPWSDDFPVTGHSTLELTHDRDDWESASAAFITAYGSDPWYNFVTNNCSDATRKAIEFATGKKINPVFFTTPGDVKDFVESELDGKSEYLTDGSVETVFNIPTKLARRLVEYSKMLNKKRFLHKK